MPKDKNRRQRGFTLIELMLVVAIIGALGAMVVPRFSVSQVTARTARVQADLRTIESAIVMFEVDVGALPADISQLTTAYTPVSGGRSYGPYLKTTPTPPSGTVRVIAADGTAATVEALSYTIDTNGRALLNDVYTVENVR